jgi:hypothetical protein
MDVRAHLPRAKQTTASCMPSMSTGAPAHPVLQTHSSCVIAPSARVVHLSLLAALQGRHGSRPLRYVATATVLPSALVRARPVSADAPGQYLPAGQSWHVLPSPCIVPYPGSQWQYARLVLPGAEVWSGLQVKVQAKRGHWSC